MEPDGLIPLDDDIDINEFRTHSEEYCGHYDSDGFRSGQGCQTWITDHYEKYEGNFLFDNLHGSGVYIIKIGSNRTICTGKFYCNDLEGYAELIYKNGIFEGLFRNNRRFGPGLQTYIDGSQDVGLWFDQTLIRLSCLVLPHCIPVFGRTAAAKTYLLQFRNLVPVIPETTEDTATEILKSLNASEEVLKNAYKLYNPYIRNRNSTFFNRRLYDDIFFENKDCYIEVADWENNEENCAEGIEEEGSEYDCTCQNPNDSRKDEILNNIEDVDNKLFDLLEKIQINKLNETDSAGDLFSTDGTTATHQIDSYKAQLETLMNFKDTLKSKLVDVAKNNQKSVSTTKVLVTELLAWNNEKMYMKMLQHCFLHKNTEKNMLFDVSKLLAGERQEFKRTGKHEKVCIEFLTKCSEGKAYEISDILRKHNLNPDLCDANGNTGVTFAVARDKILVLKELANNGANLDAVNDECLTPLTLCMARYLAVQYGISDWERGFLPEMDREEEEASDLFSISESQRISFMEDEDVEDVKHTTSSLTQFADKAKSILSKEMFANLEIEEHVEAQARGTSVTDLTKILKIFTISPGMQEFQLPYQHQPDKKQTYIFNTACVKLMEKPTLQQIREAGKRRSSTLFAETLNLDEEDDATDEKQVISKKLEVVRRTMLCLLHYGSDPDIGHVPFPALVMAVFTQKSDIVEHLLENNADPNITTLDENMTALHTVASLPPSRQLIEVGRVLLQYQANPNCRASPKHWLLLNASVLGQGFENELPDIGKTPLHLLCMRYDFIKDDANYFGSLATLLLENGANGNDMFLGHSPLSLAVVRGNIKLVETLLNLGCVDPNQKLGRGMGVPLTVLILKRYSEVLYFDVCKVILDTLLEGRANPFELIFDYGNAIDFMQRKHETRLKAEREQAQKIIEAESFEDRKRKTNHEDDKIIEEDVDITRGRRKGKVTDQVLMQNYLLERSREVLFKRIQCQTTKLLYEFMDDYIPVNDVMEIVRYLTPEDVCSNIELLLREGEMSYEDLHFDTLYRLIHFVASTTKVSSTKKRNVADTEQHSKVDYIQTARKTIEILKQMDINERPKFQGAVHPNVDPDEDKYKVCFYCCRKKGRELYKCPKCEMIYFCSELCNRLCNKSKLKHVCGLIFYKSQKVLHNQMRAADWETKLSKKMSMATSKKCERIIPLKQGQEKEPVEIKRRFKKVKPKTSLDLQRRRQSFICQIKLDQYVDIMNMHIEKLENLAEEGHGSVISLTQVAKDITEIATQINLLVSPRQSVTLGVIKSLHSKTFASNASIAKGDTSEMKFQKRLLIPAEGAVTTKTETTDIYQRRSEDKRESVSFAAPLSIKVVKDKNSESITSKRSTTDEMQIIFQTGSSKAAKASLPRSYQNNVKAVVKRSLLNAPTTDFPRMSQNNEKHIVKKCSLKAGTFQNNLKSIVKNKTPEKRLERAATLTEPLTILHSTQKEGIERCSIQTSKQNPASITKTGQKRKEKFWSTSIKRETPIIKISSKCEDTTKTTTTTTTTTLPPLSSPKKYIPPSRIKTPKNKKESTAGSAHNKTEEPKADTANKAAERKDEEKSIKNGRLTHYWFHKPFMKRLAKIFPTLDLPKLLLPFACFAEGQLYYRFGTSGSTVYRNYSKL